MINIYKNNFHLKISQIRLSFVKFNLKFYNLMKRSKSTENKSLAKKKKLKIQYESDEEIGDEDFKVEEIPTKGKFSNSKLDLMKKYESTIKLPKDFYKVWEKIKKMRDEDDAPVDTMGVDCCPDSKADRPTYKFQSLVSLILSSQTKDPITFAAMERLIKHGLTIDNIISTSEEKLRELIYGVSFYNNKSKFIKKLADILKEKYDSDAPEDLENIMTLPGVGPKMAFLYLQCCCDKTEGIAVDTHVHRICNRLKWVNETKSPEHTRKELQTWLPKELWGDINSLLVGFGQTKCSAVAPKCNQCSLNKICDFGIDRLKNLNKKSKSKSKSKSKNESKSIQSKEELSKSLKRKSENNNFETTKNMKNIKNMKKKKK